MTRFFLKNFWETRYYVRIGTEYSMSHVIASSNYFFIFSCLVNKKEKNFLQK